ncbi:MAG: pantetheine-phosphate adenylyltransferase, partial [Elusimicrobiales bacterium]|nr:pantetheine-phosphate adenylyltransferase [Elusimicrobiales bacterium]
FDPVHFGHLDLIERSSKVVDKLIVSIFNNPAKKCLFTVEERKQMLEQLLKGHGNIAVDSFEGLFVDYLRKTGIRLAIRGLRALTDLDYEFQIAATNRTLYPDMDTLFLMPRQRYTYLSSSAVREVAAFHGDLSKLVPPLVAEQLKKKFGTKQ